MKIFVVEDDQTILSFLTKGLKESGYAVDSAENGEQALSQFAASESDLVILDLMLPKVPGMTVLEKIREQNTQTPVLILSAKQAVEDRVWALQNGADDFLVKPFSFSELLARVQVLLKRSSQTLAISSLGFEDIHVDVISREVTRDGKKVDLHVKEYMLMEYFLRNPGRVLTKTQILEKVWGYGFDPQTNVVDVLVCRLRNKIDKGFKVKTIHTIRGVGYVLKKK